MDIEKIKDFCGEKLAEGMTQTDLADLLQANAKKDPKNWTVGSDSTWGLSKTSYYLRKWGLMETKPSKQADFMDLQVKSPAPFVMVMVPQDQLSQVLGVLR